MIKDINVGDILVFNKWVTVAFGTPEGHGVLRDHLVLITFIHKKLNSGQDGVLCNFVFLTLKNYCVGPAVIFFNEVSSIVNKSD